MPDPVPTPRPEELLTLANGAWATAGAVAAVVIRFTGVDTHRPMKYVAADIAGTLSLFYLVLLGCVGWWNMNWLAAVSVAGLSAAAGWLTIFGIARAFITKRMAG
jgi:hypothetical protein